jgi:hypothetical protein
VPKITIQRDICANLMIPVFATHDFLPMPPVPPTPPPTPATPLSPAALAYETITNAWWPPGMALGQNKFTTSVFHNGMAITQAGHNCGVMILHVQVSPAINNILTLPIHIPFSSRSSNFAAGTVHMDGQPVSCNTMFSWPPAPMSYCADPMSPPLASAETSHFNTVEVAMTLVDFLAGAASIAAGMLVEWAFSKPPSFKGLESIAGKLIGASSVGNWAAKQAAGNVGGLVNWLGGQGDFSLSASVGSPYMKFGVTGGYGDDGVTGGYTSRLAPIEGGVNQDGARMTLNDPFGSSTESRKWGENRSQSSTDISPMQGFRNETTTTDPSGNTTVHDSGGRGSYARGGPL